MENKESEVKYLPRYAGKDFAVWKAKIEAFFTARNAAGLLVKTKPKRVIQGTSQEIAEADAKIALFENLDRQYKYTLLLALDDKIARMVLRCKTCKELWDALISIHGKTSKENKVVTAMKFFEMHALKDDSIQDYVSRVEETYYQLLDMGVKCFDEEILVTKIVCGLPKAYISFMSAWSNLDNDRQTMTELMARLSAEEDLKGSFNVQYEVRSYDDSGQTAMVAERKVRTPQELAELKKRTKCKQCHKKGHWKNECPEKEESDLVESNTTYVATAQSQTLTGFVHRFWLVSCFLTTK